MPRHHRTPRSAMVLRTGLSTWMIIFLGSLVLGVVPGLGILFIVLAVVALFMLVASAVVRIGGHLLYGNDPEYREWIANGGDPYWDMIPPPFNRDSLAVRAGGMPEPKTDFTPPRDWLFQCNACGARNSDDAPMCWHCGNGLLQPREIVCGGCRRSMWEPVYGALETTGVRCPWCGMVVKLG